MNGASRRIQIGLGWMFVLVAGAAIHFAVLRSPAVVPLLVLLDLWLLAVVEGQIHWLINRK